LSLPPFRDDLDADEAQELLIANGHWTLPNLTAAYQKLDRAGALEYPANHSRPLKETQRLRAEQLAANGDVLGGIVEYVKGRPSAEAADEVAFTLADPLAFTTDPEMRPILEKACLFCLEAYRKDFSPSATATTDHQSDEEQNSDGPFLGRLESTAVLRLTFVDLNVQVSHCWHAPYSFLIVATRKLILPCLSFFLLPCSLTRSPALSSDPSRD
jgi:hypothetical protein